MLPVIFYLALGLSYSSVSGHFYSIYNPTASVENYYVTNPPFLLPAYNMTTCFWYKSQPSSAALEPIVSIATSESRNTLMIGRQSLNLKVTYRPYGAALIPYDDNLGWQFHCHVALFTSSTQVYKYYILEKDGTDWAIEYTSESRSVSGSRAQKEATLVLFNEQDSLGGGFSSTQVAAGWVGCLNSYSRHFEREQLYQLLSCAQQGDAFALTSGVGDMFGEVITYKDSRLAYGTEATSLSTVYCTFTDSFMLNVTDTLQSVRNNLDCLSLCTSNDDCFSTNYNKESKVCELATAEESWAMSKLSERDGWTHYSKLLCVLLYLP